jgi:Fur family transcriptional regulator, ferric uptake regulator
MTKGYSIQEIHEMLKSTGARLTPQREYILNVFFKSEPGFHLSVEDIHRVLTRKTQTNISLATVYRTVKTLSGLGILREIDLAEGHKHYELASGHENPHHHIVCLNCNKTIEFFNDEVNFLARRIADEHNVEILDVELKIFGKCLHSDSTKQLAPKLGLSEHRR